MIKGLSEGDRIEFKDILLKAEIQAGKKPNTYISQIFEFDDDLIKVAMPISKGRLIPLPKDGVFDTFFYTSKGLYQCRCRVIDRYKLNNVYTMKIALETELQKFQRRQFFRLEKMMSLMYTELTEEEYLTIIETKMVPEELYEAGRYFEGTALDVSGGGMRFVGGKHIASNKKIVVSFDAYLNSGVAKFRFPANVVLSFELPNTRGKYEHRIEFENISKENRELLIKYIFEEERKMRKAKN